MKYIFIALFCLFLFGCDDAESKQNIKSNTTTNRAKTSDTTIHILWRGMELDMASSKDSVNVVMVNTVYCKNAAPAIKAAIGFVGTFIGSDCQWDGETNDSMNNLSCKLITGLGLGFQCSEKHVGFLKHWLRNEPKLIKHLGDCPIVPFTASSQETFEDMDLILKKDTLTIIYHAAGVNMPMEKSWVYHGKYVFRAEKDELHLISQMESKPVYTSFKIGN